MRTILLLGDSLVEYGDWPELFKEYVTVNRGVAGETVGELSARLAWELEDMISPDHILIMSGTNNLLMGDDTFPAVFKTMLPRLRMLEPEAEIVVIGLAPVQVPWIRDDLPAKVNSRSKKSVLEAGCRFLDIMPDFEVYCRPVGNPCFLPDGVHFSVQGYRVLAEAVRKDLGMRV
jgi:lysophospholipase L1-like esterase